MHKIFATAEIDDYCSSTLSRYGKIEIATSHDENVLAKEAAGAMAIIVRGHAPITAKVMDAAGKLKLIGRTGVGFDTIDIAAATARGIPVVYAPGAGARAVAEAAMTYMLALCKLMTTWDREMRAGNWRSRYQYQGTDFDGKTLGIIGLGRIGQIVARMAAPFDMHVIAYDPKLDPKIAATLNVKLVSLDDVLKQSDFLTLHCPMNEETAGMINANRLSLMKKGSYLVNLARGGVIDSLDCIHDALVSGHLAGAALDVFNQEPPNFSHPIFRLQNCLTSPHAMATTVGAMTRIFQSMTDDMVAVLEGRIPKYVVNPEVLKT